MAKFELDSRYRFPGFLCTVPANEVEVISFGLFLANAVTGAVLPHTTLVTGNAVRTIVNVLPVNSANRAIKHPFLFNLKFFEFLFMSLDVGLELSFGYSGLDVSISFFFSKLGQSLLLLCELLLVKNSFDFSLFETLFPCHHSRFVCLALLASADGKS